MNRPTILRYISILYRFSQIHIAQQLKPHKIGSGQYPFIFSVCRNPGINQDGLSERLLIDKGTTAKAVKILEAGGFLRREQDPADRRVYRLYATPEGEELGKTLESILPLWQELLWKGFSRQEKEQAYSLVQRMSENAKDFLTRSAEDNSDPY
ncbi:MarR family winged helix-turn-helix transcriptional regulator [Marispirochaeta aestuarii]|uniref:MarR family winged helix-turn-helix transcriptional regulator n=1 Tax=Marispirochaeta aestuarii TaxID=1963862 RepID=UPI0029C9989A|nr:MarR family winged helix-turn-helix transcriptional regulator [Marispirochaeta aestuarii]